MQSRKLELARGSGNVFRDLGHNNADVERLKAVLAAEIIKALDWEHLTVPRRTIEPASPRPTFLASAMQTWGDSLSIASCRSSIGSVRCEVKVRVQRAQSVGQEACARKITMNQPHISHSIPPTIEGMKNELRTGRPVRYEIKKFADDAFAISRDQILWDRAEKRNQVLSQVRVTGNSGGYLPALIRWGAEGVRETILARAAADVEAFTLFGMPSDARAETSLQTIAQEIAAGTISAIRGELDLKNKRTRQHQNHSEGSLTREIEGAMRSALQEGLLALRRQRITAERSLKSGSERLPHQPAATVSGGHQLKATDHAEKAHIIELMRLIEKWRMTAGEDGGKLTQKHVADLLGLDLRAYSAAKKGEPRGKDHFGRLRKFATDRDII